MRKKTNSARRPEQIAGIKDAPFSPLPTACNPIDGPQHRPRFTRFSALTFCAQEHQTRRCQRTLHSPAIAPRTGKILRSGA